MNALHHVDRQVGDGGVTSAVAAVALTVACGCSWSIASAADWEFVPRIEVGALTDDNYNLAPVSNQQVDLAGGQIDAEFALRATSPLTEFTLAPQLISTFFPDDEEWESDDAFLKLDWSHKRERFTADLRAQYSDEATRRSELPSSDADGDLGDPDNGDGGVVSATNHRQRLQIDPKLSFDVTQRSTIFLAATYDDVDYDEESPDNTVGYSDMSASIGYGFRTSPTSLLTLSGAASRYERESDSAKADSYGVHVGWASQPSEVTRWYARVGAEEVEAVESPGSPVASGSETGFEGGLGADWTFQVTKLFVDATASVDPNASGRLIQREQLRLRLTRQFGPRLLGELGARASRDTALADEADTFRDRDYATGSLELEWRMTREFSLVGEYDLTWQDREGDVSDATSNAFRLSVVYQRHRSD